VIAFLTFFQGLATPGKPRPGSQEKPWCPTESVSSVETIQTSSGVKELPARMLPAPWRLEGLPASPAVAKLRSPAHSSSSFQGDVVNETGNVVQYRTSDETSYASRRVAVSAYIPVTDHADKGVAIPPTRPQLENRETLTVERADRGQRKFVRPRPPPLAIQSLYTEKNPGMSRVQVLADD
jgi:hypothetical protein